MNSFLDWRGPNDIHAIHVRRHVRFLELGIHTMTQLDDLFCVYSNSGSRILVRKIGTPINYPIGYNYLWVNVLNMIISKETYAENI